MSVDDDGDDYIDLSRVGLSGTDILCKNMTFYWMMFM